MADRKWWYFVCNENHGHTDCCIRLVNIPDDCPACGADITVGEMTEHRIEEENCEGEV